MPEVVAGRISLAGSKRWRRNSASSALAEAPDATGESFALLAACESSNLLGGRKKIMGFFSVLDRLSSSTVDDAFLGFFTALEVISDGSVTIVTQQSGELMDGAHHKQLVPTEALVPSSAGL